MSDINDLVYIICILMGVATVCCCVCGCAFKYFDEKSRPEDEPPTIDLGYSTSYPQPSELNGFEDPPSYEVTMSQMVHPIVPVYSSQILDYI